MIDNVYKIIVDGRPEYETADRFFIWVRNNYIKDPEALLDIQAILIREKEKQKAEYVGFVNEALSSEIGQIKRDYADGLKGSEEMPFGDYTRYCQFDRDYVTVVIENKDRYATHLIHWNDFKRMTQKEFDTECDNILYYNSYENEPEEDDPLDLFMEEMNV